MVHRNPGHRSLTLIGVGFAVASAYRVKLVCADLRHESADSLIIDYFTRVVAEFAEEFIGTHVSLYSTTCFAFSFSITAARNDSPLGNMEWIAMQNDLGRFADTEDFKALCEKLSEASGQDYGTPAELEAASTSGRGRQASGNVIDAEGGDADAGAGNGKW